MDHWKHSKQQQNLSKIPGPLVPLYFLAFCIPPRKDELECSYLVIKLSLQTIYTDTQQIKINLFNGRLYSNEPLTVLLGVQMKLSFCSLNQLGTKKTLNLRLSQTLEVLQFYLKKKKE